jgi:hypothetical protein
VPAAARFGAGLERARLGIGRVVAAESVKRLGQARRTAATAQLGDQLVGDTTRLAQQAPTGSSIAQGMR